MRKCCSCTWHTQLMAYTTRHTYPFYRWTSAEAPEGEVSSLERDARQDSGRDISESFFLVEAGGSNALHMGILTRG